MATFTTAKGKSIDIEKASVFAFRESGDNTRFVLNEKGFAADDPSVQEGYVEGKEGADFVIVQGAIGATMSAWDVIPVEPAEAPEGGNA